MASDAARLDNAAEDKVTSSYWRRTPERGEQCPSMPPQARRMDLGVLADAGPDASAL
jgi:hypothetical protein